MKGSLLNITWSAAVPTGIWGRATAKQFPYVYRSSPDFATPRRGALSARTCAVHYLTLGGPFRISEIVQGEGLMQHRWICCLATHCVVDNRVGASQIIGSHIAAK